MRLVFGTTLLALLSAALAAPPSPVQRPELRFTPRLGLTWSPRLDVVPLYAPSFGAFLMEGKFEGKPLSGWIRHHTPPGLATQSGITRFWRDNLAQAKAVGEKSKDLGCRPIASGVYQCKRVARAKGGGHVADFFVWARDESLLHVHVGPTDSETLAINGMAQLEVRLKK